MKRTGWSFCVLAACLSAIGARAEPCADMNLDGVVDSGDIAAFLDRFLASEPSADVNQDGVVDLGDITAFVGLFLSGEACEPAVLASRGYLSGGLAHLSQGKDGFLAPMRLAEPSARTPLTGLGVGPKMLGAGRDRDGGRVAVYQDLSRSRLALLRTRGLREDVSLKGDGVEQPTKLIGIRPEPIVQGTPGYVYEPRAARVHDGLVMLACSVHRYLGSGDPGELSSWDDDHTVALLWRTLAGDPESEPGWREPAWGLVRDEAAGTAGLYGAVWSMGMPVLPHPDTLLIGWTNYQWKLSGNAPNAAFLTRFDRDGAGAWSHSGSVELRRDGSDPSGQHFHVVQPHWTGTQLRVFLAIGDGARHNGLYEYYRDDLDIGAGAQPKPGAVGIDTLGTGWTDAGYVHGGDASNGFSTHGAQPTVMLSLGGRIHLGADESFPAITSFDPDRPGGTPIDDLRAEYLPHEVDADTALGWVAITGDVDDYASPGRGVILVQPSMSWGGNPQGASRVVVWDGEGWASRAVLTTNAVNGVAMGPGGEVYAEDDGAGVLIEPAGAGWYTPLVSSVGATNALTDPAWFAENIWGDRATVEEIEPGDDPRAGFPDGVRVFRVRARTEPVWAATTHMGLMPPASTPCVLEQGDSFQLRYWIRPLDAMGFNGRLIPTDGSTGHAIMRNEEGNAIPFTPRYSRLDAGDWSEFLSIGTVTEGPGPFMAGVRSETHRLDGVTAEFAYDIAIEGLYVGAIDWVLQRPGPGLALPDTRHAFALRGAGLPIEVAGVTMPMGSSGVQRALRKSRNLCTLWKDADNYLSVDAFFPTRRVQYIGMSRGQFVIGSIAFVEWTRSTPIRVRFTDAGPDLAVEVSLFGDAWREPALVPGLGGVEWEEVRLYGLAGEGQLGLGSIRATPAP
ncbi:MAG: GC-type dockerin domain-anchored protein [Phycisphaerales bacterium JB040]